MTVFEIRTGIDFLAPSRRRKRLDEMFSQLLVEDLDGRVQSFDLTAAIAAGTIAASQQRLGRAVEIRDVQIAGIAAGPVITNTCRICRPSLNENAPDSMRRMDRDDDRRRQLEGARALDTVLAGGAGSCRFVTVTGHGRHAGASRYHPGARVGDTVRAMADSKNFHDYRDSARYIQRTSFTSIDMKRSDPVIEQPPARHAGGPITGKRGGPMKLAKPWSKWSHHRGGRQRGSARRVGVSAADPHSPHTGTSAAPVHTTREPMAMSKVTIRRVAAGSLAAAAAAAGILAPVVPVAHADPSMPGCCYSPRNQFDERCAGSRFGWGPGTNTDNPGTWGRTTALGMVIASPTGNRADLRHERAGSNWIPLPCAAKIWLARSASHSTYVNGPTTALPTARIRHRYLPRHARPSTHN